jgi:hypothetical protein
MNYVVNTNTESGHPDAEDAKVTQRTQKGRKEYQNFLFNIFVLFKYCATFFAFFFGFLLRPLRNFCVLCVRKFSPSPQSHAFNKG